MTDSGLKKTAVRGVAWMGGGQVLKQVIAFGTNVVLARLLVPGDFGVFAMALIAAEFAQLFADFGIGSAIVQRRDTTPQAVSTCFWINMAASGVCALLLVVLGPLLARYFGHEVIASVLWLSAANLVINGALVIPQSLLSKQLQFRSIATAQFVGSVLGGASAIGAAFAGVGVWALAVQPLVGSTVTLVLMLLASGWRPARVFDFSSVKELLRISSDLLGSNLVGYAGRNVHNVVLGRRLGESPLGVYNLANGITYFPIYQVSAVVVKVLFPTLSHMQGDLPRLRAAYLRATGAIALVAFPAMAGVMAVSDDFVPVVFGVQWLGMIPVLKVTCWVAMVQSVGTTASTVLLAVGKTRSLFMIAILTAVAMTFALLIGTSWGLTGAAIASGLVTTASYALMLSAAFDAIKLTPGRFFREVWGPFFASVIMLGAVLVIARSCAGMVPAVRLPVCIASGAIAYILATLLVNRTQALEILALVRGQARPSPG